MIGDIYNDSWLLVKKIGKGTFSEIFVAKNVNVADVKSSYIAIKIKKSNSEGSSSSSTNILRWEADILKSSKNIVSIPRYIHYEILKDKSEYIAMEYLSGEDMSKLRDEIRLKIKGIPLPVVTYLTIQMLDTVRQFHDKGYIHRDIKPANFVRRNKESTQFCMIDFGISKVHRMKDGQIRQQRDIAEFRGTSAYASPHAHKKEDLCPRDDLYSILYVYIDLLCGQLPWTEAVRKRDKDSIMSLKTYYMEHIDEFISWINTQSQKLHTTVMNQSLVFADNPDYKMIKEAFLAMWSLKKTCDDLYQEVGDIHYSEYGFSWTNTTTNTTATTMDTKNDVGSSSNKQIKDAPSSIGNNPKDMESKAMEIQLEAEYRRLLTQDSTLYEKIFFAKGKYLGRQLRKECDKLRQLGAPVNIESDNNPSHKRMKISSVEVNSNSHLNSSSSSGSAVIVTESTHMMSNIDDFFASLPAGSSTTPTPTTTTTTTSSNHTVSHIVSHSDSSNKNHHLSSSSSSASSSSSCLQQENAVFPMVHIHYGSEWKRLIEEMITYYQYIQTPYNTTTTNVYKSETNNSATNSSSANSMNNNSIRRQSSIPNKDLTDLYTIIQQRNYTTNCIPICRMRRDLIDLYDSILRDFSRFFYCNHKYTSQYTVSTSENTDIIVSAEDDDIIWEQFIDIQKVIYLFQEKIRKPYYESLPTLVSSPPSSYHTFPTTPSTSQLHIHVPSSSRK